MSAELVPSMRETLFDSSLDGLGDVFADYAELGIDSILQDGLLKDIPIFGTIIGLCKTGASIRERNFLRQTARFISSFKSGTIDPRKLEAHKRKLGANPKEAEDELGRVILLLDRTIEAKQSEVLGRFYRAFVAGSITWKKFVELSEVNSRMFLDDYVELWNVSKGVPRRNEHASERRAYRIQRLVSLGLITESYAEVVDGNLRLPPSDERRYSLTSLGRTFTSFMGRRQ